ncbi:hypothetical protein TNCV_4024691 [Trichonephila clavipes]|uniref:Uncharacterized protein n=1 Tax=Trichonephila clavipes TaxID=2585209 RepID=A0A8X6WDM2_TRICX|nr:hypothetical protein TNCV_4024691 [Trichonephila clavipes]
MDLIGTIEVLMIEDTSREIRVQSENFSRGDHRNRGSGTNFSRGNQMQESRLNVLRVREEQNDQSQSSQDVSIKISAICMSSVELLYVSILLNEIFTKALWDTDKLGFTHVLQHEIDTGYKPPAVSRRFHYDRVKQSILEYHVEKMLKEWTIIPIQSPYTSPVVLCRKNNGYQSGSVSICRGL